MGHCEWPGSFPGRFWRSCGTRSRVQPPSEKNCALSPPLPASPLVTLRLPSLLGPLRLTKAQGALPLGRRALSLTLSASARATARGLPPCVLIGSEREARSPRGHAWPLGAMQPLHVPVGGSIWAAMPALAGCALTVFGSGSVLSPVSYPSLPRRCRPPSAEGPPRGAPRVGVSLAGG